MAYNSEVTATQTLPRIGSLALAVILVHSSSAQTTSIGSVILRNDFIPHGRPQMACVFGISGPLPKSLGRVEVLDMTGAILREGGLEPDGIFNFGVVDIPGSTAGGIGYITIRAWDSSTGNSYDQSPLRSSVVVKLTGLGGGNLPPPKLGDVSDFVGLFVLPLTSGPQSLAIGKDGDDSVRIKATGLLGEAFRLWASDDLLNWREAAGLQFARRSDEQLWWALATWDLTTTHSATFFRVTDYWSLPTDPWCWWCTN